MATVRTLAPQPTTTSPITAQPRPVSARMRVTPSGPQRVSGQPVMRLGTGAARTAVPVQRGGLVNSQAPGMSLPDNVRQRLESSFDTDLGDVRVHTDAQSAGVTDSLRARAFTFGT